MMLSGDKMKVNSKMSQESSEIDADPRATQSGHVFDRN